VSRFILPRRQILPGEHVTCVFPAGRYHQIQRDVTRRAANTSFLCGQLLVAAWARRAAQRQRLGRASSAGSPRCVSGGLRAVWLPQRVVGQKGEAPDLCYHGSRVGDWCAKTPSSGAQQHRCGRASSAGSQRCVILTASRSTQTKRAQQKFFTRRAQHHCLAGSRGWWVYMTTRCVAPAAAAG
jgi:hypothetical protein